MVDAALTCPLCGGSDLVTTVTRSRIPTLQNRVYRTADEARAARQGRFELVQCSDCGFAHNAAFDETLIEYDEHYDNLVPSAVMAAHYRAVIGRLSKRHALDRGWLLDVGCGKGAFLETACDMLPLLSGLGIDPSYEGDTSRDAGRLNFLRERFTVDQVAVAPTLVVCRHVVEHMPRPIDFLSTMRDALRRFPRTPVFVEVPDLDWILRQGAFWDFCYEHCNYFDATSLRRALKEAGLTGPYAAGNSFGDQYLWIEHDPALAPVSAEMSAQRSLDLIRYAADESRMLAHVNEHLGVLRRDGQRIVVWGMATKGVMFANLLDPDMRRIDHCIDINVKKQGCHVPLSAHRIDPPQSLLSAAGERLAVVVMNPIYLDEVKQECAGMALRATFFDAGGARLG